VTSPTDAATLLRSLGQAYGEADPALADAYYHRSLELDPCVADTHAGLAEVLVRLDRFAEAETHLRQALAIEPRHAQAAGLYATLLAASGRVPEAITYYQAATGKTQQRQLRTGFADLLARLGLRADAERHYQESLAAADDPYARANLALLVAARGEYERALRELEQAARAAPDAAEIRLNHANLLIEMGRLTQAEAELAALTSVPEVQAAAWWARSVIYERRGEAATAAAARERAARAQPELACRCFRLSHRAAVIV
jgi:tetratricopeptide (TPR) repeat protein